MQPLKGGEVGEGIAAMVELGAASDIGVNVSASARADCMPSTCCGVTTGGLYTQDKLFLVVGGAGLGSSCC